MNPSFGTGGPLLGASAPNVLGMPGGIQQQTPSSAGFTPGLLPPPPGQAPQGSQQPQGQLRSMMGNVTNPANVNMPIPQMPMPQAPQQGTVGTPPGIPETEMILKALISRLGVHSKHEEAVRNAVLPQQPQGV